MNVGDVAPPTRIRVRACAKTAQRRSGAVAQWPESDREGMAELVPGNLSRRSD